MWGVNQPTAAWMPSMGNPCRSPTRESMLPGWSLRSIDAVDAVHLATAAWLAEVGVAIDEFHTYETGLVKFSALTDIPVREPYTQQPNLL